MVFDHMFALIDNLSFSKKTENNTGTKPHHKNKNNLSLDTAFLVLATLIILLVYGFSKIRNRFKNHYRKKYTGVELREIQTAAPLAQVPKHMY